MLLGESNIPNNFDKLVQTASRLDFIKISVRFNDNLHKQPHAAGSINPYAAFNDLIGIKISEK